MEMDLGVVEDGAAGTLQSVQMHIQHPAHGEGAGRRGGIPPVDVALGDAGEGKGRPLSRPGGAGIPAVDLDAPHPGGGAGGEQLDMLPGADGPLNHGAGDHRAEALYGEYPVYGQAEGAAGVLLSSLGGQLAQDLPQGGQALSYPNGYWQDRRVFQKGPGGPLPEVPAQSVQSGGACKVGLGQDDRPCRDAQQLQDIQMLRCLRHEALVGGYHQHGKIDAACAGDDVADELLVAGDIDDGDLRPRERQGRSRPRW